MENGSILGFAINFIEDILAWAEVFFFMTKILMMKPSKKAVNWIVVGALMVGGFIGRLFVIDYVMDLIVGIVSIITIILCIEERLADKVVRLIFVFFYLNVFETIITSIANICKIVIGRELSIGGVSEFALIAGEGVIVIVVLLIGKLVERISGYEKWIKNVKKEVFILLAVYSISFSVLILYINYTNEGLNNNLFGVIIGLFACVSVYAICIGLAKINYTSYQLERENVLKEQYLRASREYYKNLKWQIDEMRRVKHDMNAQYLALDMYMCSEKFQEAREYLATIRKHQLDAYKSYFTVGNELVDAVIYGIINPYKGVKLNITGTISKCDVKDYDLCIIFSNLIQNAAEAICDIDEDKRTINIDIRHFNEWMILNISNPITKKVDIKNLGNYTTKKDDEHFHGYGISNVKKTVAAYGGKVDFSINDNLFIAKISIYDKL